ncbi:hypothetical protein DFJ43DRAFT_1001983, partial [Lentinula guzmanii]
MYEELGKKFEEKLLKVASHFTQTISENPEINSKQLSCKIFHAQTFPILNGGERCEDYFTSQSYNILIGMSSDELVSWQAGYEQDPYFSRVISDLRSEENHLNPHYPQYHYSESGLLYFEDWHGNNRLCVPKNLRNEIMNDVHNLPTESAHAG